MKQFLFGQAANSSLYFILLCVINTVLIWVILKWVGKWGVYILCTLSVGMLLMQYCGVNDRLWDWLPVHGRMTFGRFFELFPYSAIGLVTGKLLRYHKDLAGAVLSYGMTLIVMWGVCEWFGCLQLCGFGYAGLPRLFGSVGISLVALALGDMIVIEGGNMIAYLASLTAGIYYMHKIVGSVISLVMPTLRAYFLTLVVFVVCALCCALIKRSRALAILVK